MKVQSALGLTEEGHWQKYFTCSFNNELTFYNTVFTVLRFCTLYAELFLLNNLKNCDDIFVEKMCNFTVVGKTYSA